MKYFEGDEPSGQRLHAALGAAGVDAMNNVRKTDRQSKPAYEPETIACEVCMKEIPRSVAHSHEGQDYVLHFCGSNCFDRWRDGIKPDEG